MGGALDRLGVFFESVFVSNFMGVGVPQTELLNCAHAMENLCVGLFACARVLPHIVPCHRVGLTTAIVFVVFSGSPMLLPHRFGAHAAPALWCWASRQLQGSVGVHRHRRTSPGRAACLQMPGSAFDYDFGAVLGGAGRHTTLLLRTNHADQLSTAVSMCRCMQWKGCKLCVPPYPRQAHQWAHVASATPAAEICAAHRAHACLTESSAPMNGPEHARATPAQVHGSNIRSPDGRHHSCRGPLRM